MIGNLRKQNSYFRVRIYMEYILILAELISWCAELCYNSIVPLRSKCDFFYNYPRHVNEKVEISIIHHIFWWNGT